MSQPTLTTTPHNAPSACARSADAALQWERDMADVLRYHLTHNEQLIGLMAQALVDGMRKTFGGQKLWIPAGDTVRRNAAICAAYTWGNSCEVAAMYGITERTVQRIVRAARKRATF